MAGPSANFAAESYSDANLAKSADEKIKPNSPEINTFKMINN